MFHCPAFIIHKVAVLLYGTLESGAVTLWENGVTWYNGRAVFP